MPVDWWTLGSIIYEMLVGVPPFYTNNRQELFERIKFLPPKYPPTISSVTRNLLEGLLRKDPSKRLGSLRDAEEVREHPWFAGINWQLIRDKKYEAPFVPKISGDMGLGNFDSDFTEIPVNSLEMTQDNNSCKVYDNFSWNADSINLHMHKSPPTNSNGNTVANENRMNLEPIGEKNELDSDSKMIDDD